MNLIEIYSLLQSKEITENQAADALGMRLSSFRSRCTKWGHKFPLMLSVLDKIKADKITRDDAAKALGVTTRSVNKLSQSWNVSRPIKAYLVNRTVSKVKWEVRKKNAIDYISGTMQLEEAAERSSVTERQMRRWVSEMLDKHFGMVWKDLSTLSDIRRRRLANEIEDAEGLEMAKQNVINAISRGDKTLEEEALERVAVRRAKTRRPDVRSTRE